MGKRTRYNRHGFFILLIGTVILLLNPCSGCFDSGRNRNLQQEGGEPLSGESYSKEDQEKETINARQNSSNQDQALARPDAGQNPAALFEQSRQAVISIVASTESGLIQASGFFISSKGVAVSNYHVFEGIKTSG